MTDQARTERRDSTRLVVALGIVATLLFIGSVGIAALTAAATGETVRKDTCASNVANINTQVERWYFEHGSWPAADLHDIARDTTRFPNDLPVCPVTGAPYTLDPVTHRVTGHVH